MRDLTNMYSAVTPDDLRGIMSDGGEVPTHFAELSGATLRAGVFLAATAVGRECMPPRTAFEVVGDAMPIIREALGVQTPPL
jgi:hypothetical protein